MKRLLSSRSLMVALCVSLFAWSAYAQFQTGNIYGKTQAKDGSVLPGVTVTLGGVGAQQTGVSDAQGNFRFLNLSPGTYSLKAELAGEGFPLGDDTVTVRELLDSYEADLERLGTFGKCAPPLRPRQQVDDLWRALLEGAFDYVASDHSPCPPEMKQTDDVWSAWGGLSGVQTLLPALLTEGVHARVSPRPSRSGQGIVELFGRRLGCRSYSPLYAGVELKRLCRT